MLQHSLLLIYRNFLRFKSTFFINLLGLSTGLACTLLIYLWVRDEVSVDGFHKNENRLYQVMENASPTGSITTSAETPARLAEVLVDELPEIEFAAVSTPPAWFSKVNLSVGEKAIKAAGVFGGKDYFNIFSYELLQGDQNQVLGDKTAMVISEEMALKLFNSTENILGKTVTWHLDQFQKQGVITGIFKAPPHTSTVQFDFVLPFTAFHDLVPMTAEWDNRGPFFTYVVLAEGADTAHVNAKIAAFFKRKTNDANRTLFLKPYAENYLYGKYENGVQVGGRIEYVHMFSLIAFFILLIACINFMNLSTAKASRRIKEVGVKKVLGASRKFLVLQYGGEALLLAFLSLLLAICYVELALPHFNQITGKQLALLLDLKGTLVLLGITLFTGIMAGSYPAFYLSGFRPATVLKGKIHASVGERLGRKGLVVFQFTLSVVFIVAVLVIYNQINYVQTKSLGYDKEQVLFFESEGKVPASMDTFLEEVKKVPGVLNASSMVARVQGGPSVSIPWQGEGQQQDIPFRPLLVNYDLIETLGIEIKEGRSFSRNHGADQAKIILNEAAITAMGLQDPIGKIFEGKEIIGVAKNFHFQSLHEEVKPLFFVLDKLTGTVLVKIEAGKERETIERLQTFYKEYNPGFSFEYTFLEEEYQAQYAAEMQVAALSKYAAGIATLLSCLGLFGLAAFTAEQRTKEIGIRKVLGASVASIMGLLSKDFVQLVAIAIGLGSALAWYLMREWLQGFVYRIDLSWWVFALTGALTLLIALLTVSFQAVKAALMNPVKSLRSE